MDTMRRIEFRQGGKGTGDLMEIVIDDVPLLELVREAELPFARQEQLERQPDFAPEPAPLLAGDYQSFSRARFGWPSRHYLGEPAETACNQNDDEIMLLGCTCGIADCWALLARIEIDGAVVRWSGFRNNHRDWDLTGRLGPFVFSRRQYEHALHTTAPTPHDHPPAVPPLLNGLRLIPVIDTLSGLLDHLPPPAISPTAPAEYTSSEPTAPSDASDHAPSEWTAPSDSGEHAPPAPPPSSADISALDEELRNAYWTARVIAAGLPAPIPGHRPAALIRLSDFFAEGPLLTLLQASLRRDFADSDSDSDSDSDPGTGIRTSTGADADTSVRTDLGAGTRAATDSGTDISTDTEIRTATGIDTDTGIRTDVGTSTATGTDSGTEIRTGTGTDLPLRPSAPTDSTGNVGDPSEVTLPSPPDRATDDMSDVRRHLAQDPDAIDRISPLPGGYLLLAEDGTIVSPGCCSDLSDVLNWGNAARHTDTSPCMVWVGHPWVHVAADGDALLLTGPTERDPGPELGWLPRQALAQAADIAAAEVRYFARCLDAACTRLLGEDHATAVCNALLGDPWLRIGPS
ncbi:hypothetical protein [Nonomuraea fuscirosea]|uniref:hypothetical protein n=1 Tax=Nonomuraea fuscirosea TaxID=1291556 RepID=UPI003428A37E